MARPKAPKKNSEVKDAVPNPQPATNPAPIARPVFTTSGSAAAAPAPAMETVSNPVKAKAMVKKPENGRADSRATVVPRNLVSMNLDEEIRQLAYLRSERRGFEPGHETEDWLAAEHEVLERYEQHSA